MTINNYNINLARKEHIDYQNIPIQHPLTTPQLSTTLGNKRIRTKTITTNIQATSHTPRNRGKRQKSNNNNSNSVYIPSKNTKPHTTPDASPTQSDDEGQTGDNIFIDNINTIVSNYATKYIEPMNKCNQKKRKKMITTQLLTNNKRYFKVPTIIGDHLLDYLSEFINHFYGESYNNVIEEISPDDIDNRGDDDIYNNNDMNEYINNNTSNIRTPVAARKVATTSIPSVPATGILHTI